MSSNPNVAAIGPTLAAQAIGAAVTLADTSRAMWQQQLAVAEATERVQDRQLRLLFAQRAVINDQIEVVTRKRDDATRLVLQAQQVLDEPMIVDKLDPANPAHRARAWRGQAGEVWRYHDDEYAKIGDGLGTFLWTYEHPAAISRQADAPIGGPFTEVRQ
ncbi:hypothetical protein SEA_GUANICA15_67 [Mycobacterium phage Guanica15]|uniref:Uncharacterized protein n=1 Tax=Mycobacterium phage Yunkel11 TaxID=2599886 RepID=A0A5J6TC00_9CAUD|nr:hypothetical protein I5H09_gp039 [Mycobacterium phage Yunkel11]QFG08453.1 hypothetical protein SEA_YUNKEL11_67 [Mycobacterium phage Yunkel11]QFG11677.1 hypothetical protein SEA_GUANICA15_67 [Mycobacterium phage Guanica15]